MLGTLGALNAGQQRSAIETLLCHQHHQTARLRALALCCIQCTCPAFSALSESLLLPVCERSLCLRRASSSRSGICQLADLPASARTPPRRLKKSRSSSGSPTVPQFACSANPTHVDLACPEQQKGHDHGRSYRFSLITNDASEHYVLIDRPS